MGAPLWELEDPEWRPTWTQELRFGHGEPGARDLPGFGSLAQYMLALSDLEAPKQALVSSRYVPRCTACCPVGVFPGTIRLCPS